MEAFKISLAGVTVQINTNDASQKKRMQDFLTEGGNPAFCVEIAEAFLERTLKMLRMSNGESYAPSKSYLEFIAIHSAIAEKMLDYDVLVMHGSCLQMYGEGYIFTAKSGTGKSTHARLWREVYGNRVKMVNDDKPMLICRDDEIVACGTPWNGKEHLGENTSVKVKAIAFLERGSENEIEAVKPEALFEKLYTQTYHSKDKLKQMKAMELLSRICKNVKMYRLKVNMEPDAAKVSYEGMR